MMERMPWHPIAVHFPIALVVTAAFTLSAARLKPLERVAAPLAIVGTWDLCLGAIAALVALATGLAAILNLEVGLAARLAIAVHVKWAIFASVGLLLLAVWRAAGNVQDSPPSRVFVVLLWVVTAALTVTGYRGGQNVYRYGVGVAVTGVGMAEGTGAGAVSPGAAK
jgi:uncharacterized membrane protein